MSVLLFLLLEFRSAISFRSRQYHSTTNAHLLPIIAIVALLSFLIYPSLSVANTNKVKDLRFSDATDLSRLVIELEKDAKFTYFTLKNPNRVVIDLQDVDKNFSFSDLSIVGSKIKKIRHSAPKSNNDTRIVIETNKKLNPRLFVLAPTNQGVGGSNFRLVIELVDPNPPPIPVAIGNGVPINSNGPIRDNDIIIVIDPGHGGVDPGSIGPQGTFEKHITLSVAKMLARLINQEKGMRAVLTREGDYYISPNERPRIAVREGADLMVSIHADAFTTPQPRGGSVWVLSKGRADSELGRLLEQTERSSELLGPAAEVIEDRETERYFAETILNMSMDLFRALSYELSNEIISDMKNVTRMHKKTPQSASLAVLTAPETPSVLVEVGFISNPQEEKNLLWAEHRERLAQSIFNAIKRYFKKTPPDGTLWAKLKNQTPIEHKVKSGESLSILAQQYGVSVSELKVENKLNSDLLRIGQVLVIPR